MLSRISIVVVVVTFICLLAGTAVADRLVTIPTGSTIGTGAKAEYLTGTGSGSGEAVLVNAALSIIEVEGAWFDGFGGDSSTAFGIQAVVLPQTSFTPALSIGIRDIGDATDSSTSLYDGRAFYVAISHPLPEAAWFTDARVHAGLGTGSLSGLFYGADVTVGGSLNLAVENDTEDFNFKISYKVIPLFNVSLSSIKGDTYLGGTLTLAF